MSLTLVNSDSGVLSTPGIRLSNFNDAAELDYSGSVSGSQEKNKGGDDNKTIT